MGVPPKKLGTASSMMLCFFTKLSVVSGSFLESTEHLPGLGLGSLILGTGSQLELDVSCSLKAPSKVSNRSRSLKKNMKIRIKKYRSINNLRLLRSHLNAQMALAAIEFFGVVNTA